MKQTADKNGRLATGEISRQKWVVGWTPVESDADKAEKNVWDWSSHAIIDSTWLYNMLISNASQLAVRDSVQKSSNFMGMGDIEDNHGNKNEQWVKDI